MQSLPTMESYNKFLVGCLGLFVNNTKLDMQGFAAAAANVMVNLMNAPESKKNPHLTANIRIDIFLKGIEKYFKNAENIDFGITYSDEEARTGIFKVLRNITGLSKMQLMGRTDDLENAYIAYIKSNKNIETACEFLQVFRKERFKLNELQYTNSKKRDP